MGRASAPVSLSTSIRRASVGLLFALVARAAEPSPSAPTFNRDIAPIVFSNCVVCHHPGGLGPFSLTSYAEVKKRARQIAEVTGTRLMPPWMPEPGRGVFHGERGLSAGQIAMLRQWSENGTPEGHPGDLTAKALWHDEWQFGQPDLIVTMPESFTLPSEGKDVYRNFVVPVPLNEKRYVRAIDFHPGDARVVHHAFLLLDTDGNARRQSGADGAPGYSGMEAGHGVFPPPGHFTSWQPGKLPDKGSEGLSWVLEKGTDLVFQLHMRPSGKPEKVRASIGLYFTDKPPVKVPFVMPLRSTRIDIPPGAKDYMITAFYDLPVDVQLLGVLPHAHYLGRELQAWATFPDGTQDWLLHIKNWDFLWQGDYRYATPVSLPRGTKITMRWIFDNSSDNPRNPTNPPQRVRYGLQTTDEMGEFWLQMVTSTASDMAMLQRDHVAKVGLPDKLARSEVLLSRDPHDAATRVELACAHYASGLPDQAVREAEQALRDNPNLPRAHDLLGRIYAERRDLPRTELAFAAVVRLDPENAGAHNNLGYILLLQDRAAEAVPLFERALALNPRDALARESLAKARARLRN